jgi:outer membrane immunogenic protein
MSRQLSGVKRTSQFDRAAAARWTFGLGTEWVLFENWSIFGEWDYLNFGTRNVTFTDPNNGSNQFTIKQNINELKLGVNYRFGNPLPGYP